MIRSIKKSTLITCSLISTIFTFIPESFFKSYEWLSQDTLKKYNFFSTFNLQDLNIIISRITCFISIYTIVIILYSLYLYFRKKTIIKGQNYEIIIEYGDIFKKKNCKRVISFDECFTTKIGNRIADINEKSICGQYLMSHQNLDIQRLLDDNEIKPIKSRSRYKKKIRYRSGTIVPNGDDLLMAFVKLDENGKGKFFSRDEYIKCLDFLWQELENYSSEEDVCIPILGSGTTSFDSVSGASISKKELLDIMILSYKLSSHKIKSPNKLRIVCQKTADFSINDIE